VEVHYRNLGGRISSADACHVRSNLTSTEAQIQTVRKHFRESLDDILLSSIHRNTLLGRTGKKYIRNSSKSTTSYPVQSGCLKSTENRKTWSGALIRYERLQDLVPMFKIGNVVTVQDQMCISRQERMY